LFDKYSFSELSCNITVDFQLVSSIACEKQLIKIEPIWKISALLILYFPLSHKAGLRNLKDNDAEGGDIGHNQQQLM